MIGSLLTNVTVIPMDGPAEAPLGHIRPRSIRIRDGRITDLGDLAQVPEERLDDGGGLVALPGFVQGHVHYCQTLFRGLADDLPLMDWLQRRIWPLEAAHDPDSIRASARLSVAELLLGGTTTAQVMESVHHTEASIEVATASGMVTLIGNCLMDVAAAGVPAGLATTTDEAMRLVETLRALVRPPVEYVVSPRFILSCSDGLTQQAAAFASDFGLRIHTHASEHRDEVELVRERTGTDCILALRDRGLLGEHTSLAHCIHTTTAERDALVDSGAAVLHCPTTNLKLGSGLAPIAEYARRGVPIALGADGAPCNNRLSMLTELRQAVLVQATVAGPGQWTATDALFAATAGGAAALGLDHDLGSITVGKRADLVLVDLDRPPMLPGGDLASRLAFTAETGNIRHVMVSGEWKVRDGELLSMDHVEISRDAETQLTALLSRAGLAR